MSRAALFLRDMQNFSAEHPLMRLYPVYAECRRPYSMRDVRRVYQALVLVTGTRDAGDHLTRLTDWGLDKSHHDTLKAIYDALDLIVREDTGGLWLTDGSELALAT